MALLYSYLFVFAIIAISEGLNRLGILGDEGSRKFIHIGVGNWIVVAPFVYDNIWLAVIPPFTFIVLNYVSYRFDLIKAMERDDKNDNSLGTVYYAVSLFLVMLLDVSFFQEIKLSILPILVMAYGDGLSAIIGSKFPSRKLVGNKTIYGTITMIVVSLILGFVFLNTWWMIVLVAIAATVIELYSPKGIDNLSVPLGLYALLFILL